MTDAELIKVLQQIRDELREMNGKDSEGNRKPPVSPWMPPTQQPYPMPTYPPYWNTVTARDSRTGYGWLLNNGVDTEPED